MDDNHPSTMDTSSLSISVPIHEPNDENLLAISVSLPYADAGGKVMNLDDEERRQQQQQSEPMLSGIEPISHGSPLVNLDGSEVKRVCDEQFSTMISAILDALITKIESNSDTSLTALAAIEDEQMEMDDDDEIDEEEEEEVETDNTNTNLLHRSSKTDKERTAIITKTKSSSSSSSSSSKRDLKPTTRTLRSHARGKLPLSSLIQTSSSNPDTNGRRVSNRRRALEMKLSIVSNEKGRQRRTISERSRKEKDHPQLVNDDIQTSSNSDDQLTDNTNTEKVTNSTTNPNDDASSCSSTGAGEGSSTSSSTITTKQSIQTSTDLDSLPPNKRRVREKHPVLSSATLPPVNETPTNAIADNLPADDSPVARELPTNGIKQFLEIRQQIDKRHETMLNEFVLPKVPKDFAQTTMAKKSYLIASSFTPYSINTPASLGIKRSNPPHDLDGHLADVFSKQEDERYKTKLRHQVERDKLILSYEQEVLRLYGNASRSLKNQEIPFSYCSLLKDNEVYNNPSIPLPDKERHTTMLNADCPSVELGKRGKTRCNGRSFLKWLEDSNLKYKRLSCELNERQRLEADTLYSIQRMVWSKHLPKESLNLSATGRTSYFLNERYLPKVEINPNFWTHWETNPF